MIFSLGETGALIKTDFYDMWAGGEACLFQSHPIHIYQSVQRTLKVTYHTTRCECDWPLQAVWKPLLMPYHKCECPPRRVLDGSVHQPSQWTVANVSHLSSTHLGGHAHL